jgi:hypothetical protein
MSDLETGMRPMKRGSRALLGLLMVLAFLGHDVIMAVQHPALAVDRPSLALGLEPDTFEAHATAPYPDSCQIGQVMVLKAPDAALWHSTAGVIVGHPILTRLTGLPWNVAVTHARSPTAQRAVLQIFRL